ncbi:hypothetical protein NQ315_008625 [Exocentrus adspersus]|uniref:C2H2-type domain-containing protein n=1 Tax=Exocentrus adspersus TaxID=1586481 RepID=A0AAV8W6A4_9CUCU|nr:hypothetical protein NQ315_008625 [Exocentrus adspersus]
MDSNNIVCPVCTLYLRPGITLKQHLSSHPKQKVIEALVKLSVGEESPKVHNAPAQPDLTTASSSQVNSAVANQPWTPAPPSHLGPPPPLTPIHGNHVFIYQQSMSTTSPQPNVLNVNPLSQQYVYPTVFNPQMMPYVYQQQQVIMSSNSLPPHVRALPFDLPTSQASTAPEQPVVECETQDSIPQTRIEEVQENEDPGEVEEQEEVAGEPESALVKKQEEVEIVNHEVKTMQDFENERLMVSEIPPEDYGHESSTNYDNEQVDHEECVGSPRSQSNSHSDWAFHSDLNKACQTQNTSNVSPRSNNTLEEEPELDNQEDNVDQPEYFYIHPENEEFVKQQSEEYPEQSVPYTTVKLNAESYEQSEPIYTSANILHGGDHFDFVNMDDIVIINDFPSSQVVSQVDNFGGSSPDRPGVLMTIGDIQEQPKSNFIEQRDLEESMSRESSHVNIRSDERMPARGELSGQESIGGASDITWNRMQYQEGSSGMSHSYDLIGRETWEASDSDSVEVPSIQRRQSLQMDYQPHMEFNDNDNPTIVSYSGPPLNFKCPTCQEGFASSKERKEHEIEKHPEKANRSNLIGADIGRKKVKKLVVKLKSDKTETESNYDNVFTNKLKIENNVEQSEAPVMEQEIKQDEPNLGLQDLKIVCPICDYVVQNAKALRVHKLEVHKETTTVRHKCLTCGEAFPNEYKYTDHLKIHPLECRLCGKLFYRRQNIQLHMKRHLGLKPYKCEVCQKSFVTRQKHDEHKNVHTGESPIKCNLCEETFRRHSNLVQHRNRHHFQLKKKIKDYICQCGEIFHSKKKLAWHKEIHDTKPKSCTQCSEKFVHMSSLTRHMRRAHNDKFLPQLERDNENVECPICKGTYLRSSLDVHIRKHSGQRPFTCLICNKDFTTKWNLKLHKWTHASRTSKPFKCDQCKGAFIRESDYVAHMNSHKSVRPYTCNYCGAQFIRKYNCLRHVKEHENNKTFVCQVCGKSFHRSYYLKDHMLVHSGIRPYSCHICGKTSTTKSNHNKHVQIHHAREPVSTEN